MEHLTPEQVMDTAAVLLTMFAAIVTLDKVREIIKKWKSPSLDVSKKLARDRERLDEHEKEINTLRDSGRVQCAALLALLDHEPHNGNSDQMERAKENINRYLQGLL